MSKSVHQSVCLPCSCLTVLKANITLRVPSAIQSQAHKKIRNAKLAVEEKGTALLFI